MTRLAHLALFPFSFNTMQRSSQPWHLSNRQMQVADLVGQGLSNREIADTLGLSTATVKFYLANIFTELVDSGQLRRDRAPRVQIALWSYSLAHRNEQAV